MINNAHNFEIYDQNSWKSHNFVFWRWIEIFEFFSELEKWRIFECLLKILLLILLELANVIEEIEHGLRLARWPHFGKNVPKAQRFVSGAGHDAFAVRTSCQVEHAVGVAGQLGHLGEWGVTPDEDLVLWVAVGGDELVGVLRPGQVAHLATRVDRLQRLLGQRIPKFDASD